MTTPTCPGCRAKFQHDNALLCCKACGLPDEVAARGHRAVQAWQKATGRPLSRGGSVQRRRRAHGRSKAHPARSRS